MRSLVSTLAALLVLAASVPAPAATVTGRITGAPPPPTARHSGYGKYRRGPEPSAKVPHPLIVVLEPKNGVVPPPPAEHPVMDQRNERFSPRALAVMAGGTVDFLNSDAFYHNVFSLSSPKKFDLGRYRQGHSRPVTFTKPGLVKLFCDIHPDMIGYILVTGSPWFASASTTGDFTVDGVPPGDYTVKVWHEALAEPVTLRSLTVRGDAAGLDLDLGNPDGP